MKGLLFPRLAAFAIDHLALLALIAGWVCAVGEPSPGGGYQMQGVQVLLIPGLWVFWLVVPESIWGATLGKRLFGLKVAAVDGSHLGYCDAFLRRLCDVVDFWMTCGVVAAICHLKTERGQRVGDLAVDAVVVSTKSAVMQTAGPALEGEGTEIAPR